MLVLGRWRARTTGTMTAMAQPSPLGVVVRGLAAGAVATAAKTGYQTLVAKLMRQENAPVPESWKDAPAPAQVGKRILTGVFQERVPLDQVERLTNVMHWTYGTGWGTAYGLLQGTVGAPQLRAGATLAPGSGRWPTHRVPMGIYQAPWKYPPKELALDLSCHLVYGISAALAFAALTRR